MNEKQSAYITGVLQDWDIYDNRFDIEEVDVQVPLAEFEGFSDEDIEDMVEYGYDGCGDSTDSKLMSIIEHGIEHGWFKTCRVWDIEDACELKLEFKEA